MDHLTEKSKLSSVGLSEFLARAGMLSVIVLMLLAMSGCGLGNGGIAGTPCTTCAGNTTTSLTASPATVAPGSVTTLTAETAAVIAGFTAPTGYITFYDGSAALGTATFTGYSPATLSASFSTPGAHSLTAVYGGNTNAGFNSSTSSAVTVNVTAGSSPLPGAASYVYVIQNTSGAAQILQFAATGNGKVTPLATLTLPTSFAVTSIATDSVGQIYVGGNLSTGLIYIYAAGATGTATPVRTIIPQNTYGPTAMTVNASGMLYTVDGDSQVTVYSSTASGSAAPARLISGAATTLNLLGGIAVDTNGDIYVSSNVISNTPIPSLLMFSPSANGNAAPMRTITGSTGLNVGVAVDASGNVYVGQDTSFTTNAAQILEYVGGATGSATPLRTIAGTATGLETAGGVQVDSAGNIYIANQIPVAGTQYSYAIDVFGPTQTGNVVPEAGLTSTSWTVGGSQIAIR